MRPDNEPVTCRWTAEELNDRSIAFTPARNGLGTRVKGQLLAVQLPMGLYIQVSFTRPNGQSALHWFTQNEADRMRKNPTGETDFEVA